MGKIRYIGSKARVVEAILDRAGPANGGRFVDVFSGTGVVSHEAAKLGWSICANDHLLSASIVTTAQVLADGDVPFRSFGGYAEAVAALNDAPTRKGFLFRECTPSGESRSGHQRRYFTCENGKRIDGMRSQIDAWFNQGKLTDHERTLLIADLLDAANTVANIAGTYGCFLRHWTQSALRPIKVTIRDLLPAPTKFAVTMLDAFEVKADRDDLVYLDPPYTKRQYASYYHILETIAAGDSPKVEGVSGLRPWRAKASPFCYKRIALEALATLSANIGADRVLISYNSEGHIPLGALQAALQDCGRATVHELAEVGRYRPNRAATDNASSVTEYLIELTRSRRASTRQASRRFEWPSSVTWPLAVGAC